MFGPMSKFQPKAFHAVARSASDTRQRLDVPDRPGTVPTNLTGNLVCAVEQARVWHDLVDETPCRQLASLQGGRREEQLGGMRRRKPLAQSNGRATGRHDAVARMASNSFRSPPAEKARPLPVTMMTLRPGRPSRVSVAIAQANTNSADRLPLPADRERRCASPRKPTLPSTGSPCPGFKAMAAAVSVIP